MDIRKFSREIIAVAPPMHAMFAKGLPSIIKGGKVTFPQMVILDILRVKGENKMSDMSRVLGVTKSAVTGLVDRLIRTGLVRRERQRKQRVLSPVGRM